MANDKRVPVGDRFSEEPAWPTTLRSRMTDGRMVGTDGSVWIYREVPLGPVVDAASPAAGLDVAYPLMNAFEELASLNSGGTQRRSVAKSGYREFHLLLVNVPQKYTPPRGHPIEAYLRTSFGRINVDNRVLLLGIKLQANVGGEGGIRDAIDSVVETLTSGGTPLSDYDKDFKKVDASMGRAGLFPASAEALHTANAWWNGGRNPDTPLLVHDDHLHFFSTVDSVRMAAKAGVDDCRNWDEAGVVGQSAATFACVEDLDLPFIDPTATQATWVSDLLDADALAVSIRGQVEPAKVTRSELRRQKKRYIDDVNERAQNNKMGRAEQDEMLQRLGEVENHYATGGTPTLAGTSIVLALDGQVEDLSQAIWQHSPARLASMLFRQPGAFAEMMLCSNVRSNPNLHDLPSQSVVFSGLPSLSFVGDRDRNGEGDGAQLGFTQRDRQPAFLSPTAASALDSLPLALVAGSTGSGKTVLLLNLADQYSRMGNPVIIVDPKALSLDTQIPTPNGVTTMGDIKVGSQVFDRFGKPCNVTHKSKVFTDTNLYEFVLDDGQVITADEHHQWVVLDAKSRTRMTHDGSTADDTYVREMTTAQMLEEGIQKYGQTNFAIPVASSPNFPEANLPVDPYLMGVWLGDGNTKDKDIHVGTDDLDAMLSNVREVWPSAFTRPAGDNHVIVCGRDLNLCAYGHDAYVSVNHGDRVTKRCGKCESDYQGAYRAGQSDYSRGDKSNPSLQHLLRNAGVLGDKHIPEVYFTASTEQRFALLQGLMDTDGTVKRRGEQRISLTNEHLARGLLRLVRSLGIKAHIWEGDARISQNGAVRTTGRQWVVTFRTTKKVFRLERKQALVPTVEAKRAGLLFVKEVRPVASREAQCIRVDSPDHTYLVADYVPTHNTGSDHSPVVLGAGGQVNSLDDLTRSDGVFDPIRFSATKDVGVELATSMLMSINPWGSHKEDMEVPLQHALHHGVSHGASCIGQALRIAERELDDLPPGLIKGVFDLTGSSPMFRACVGVDPSTTGLRAADGITLIKVGNSHLDLPEPGVPPASITQRIALALVRMMVFGSAMALTGRQGVVMLDEAWVFLGAGATEVQRLGRLARSQGVLPMLFTQRVSDAIDANLEGYISRGLILPIEDKNEALAACKLFKLEATPDRIAKITAKGTISSTNANAVAPNWDSMRALRDPKTGMVLRGSIAIYADIHGRAIPVEIALSPDFLRLASTNPDDIKARDKSRAVV